MPSRVISFSTLAVLMFTIPSSSEMAGTAHDITKAIISIVAKIMVALFIHPPFLVICLSRSDFLALSSRTLLSGLFGNK